MKEVELNEVIDVTCTDLDNDDVSAIKFIADCNGYATYKGKRYKVSSNSISTSIKEIKMPATSAIIFHPPTISFGKAVTILTASGILSDPTEKLYSFKGTDYSVKYLKESNSYTVEIYDAPLYAPLNIRDLSTIRSYNVGKSDYSKHKIQPWDIWLEYKLNPWDADIIKRVLRTKEGTPRIEEYEKIIHDCQERIRQLKEGL